MKKIIRWLKSNIDKEDLSLIGGGFAFFGCMAVIVYGFGFLNLIVGR